MGTASGVAEHYELLVALNQEMFERGNYPAACHTLAAALHCAAELGAIARLDEVQRRAYAQRAAIDADPAGGGMPALSPHTRAARVVYASIAREANSFAEIIRVRGRAPVGRR